jgi:integrase
MEPDRGRERVIRFSATLVSSGVKGSSINAFLGAMRREFAFVLADSTIPAHALNGNKTESILEKYGPIVQPVHIFDYPPHRLDLDPKKFALIGKDLDDFFEFARTDYIRHSKRPLVAAQDHTMAVVAGCCGFRKFETIKVNSGKTDCDIFSEINRIQTRYGKAKKGSARRMRQSIYPPYAEDTVAVFLNNVRPNFPDANLYDELFLSVNGGPFPYNSTHAAIRRIADAARKAGIALTPGFGWHGLRRCFATNFVDNYPDLIELLNFVMALLGHTSEETLGRYIMHPPKYHDAICAESCRTLIPWQPLPESMLVTPEGIIPGADSLITPFDGSLCGIDPGGIDLLPLALGSFAKAGPDASDALDGAQTAEERPGTGSWLSNLFPAPYGYPLLDLSRWKEA